MFFIQKTGTKQRSSQLLYKLTPKTIVIYCSIKPINKKTGKSKKKIAPKKLKSFGKNVSRIALIASSAAIRKSNNQLLSSLTRHVKSTIQPTTALKQSRRASVLQVEADELQREVTPFARGGFELLSRNKTEN